MGNEKASKQTQFGYFVSALGSCKTILQLSRRASYIVYALTFVLFACNQKTENHTHNESADPTMTNMDTRTDGGGGGTGTGDGGGGQGVSCSDKVSDPRFKGKVVVRDIYEALKTHSRTLKTIPNDISGTDSVDPQAIKVLVQSIRQYFGPASVDLEFANEKYWVDFVKKISFLDEESQLHPSRDANSPIALPSECKIVQIAFWDESAGMDDNDMLFVNRVLWRKLDQTSKIGLLAHEFFFKQARKAKYKNSDFVRVKVGKLLSRQGLQPLFESWVPSRDPRVSNSLPEFNEGYKHCKGTSKVDPSAKADLFQYKGSDGFQHLVIMNLESSRISASLFSSTHTRFDPSDNKNLAAALDIFTMSKHLVDYGALSSERRSSDESRIFKIRYSGLGSIPFLMRNSSDGNDDFRQDIIFTLSKLSEENKSEIWTGYLPSPQGDIRLGIVNPGMGFKEISREMLSRDELIKNLISLVHERLHYCTWQSDDDLDMLLSALFSEVDDSIRSGKYPDGFPRWKAALQELEIRHPKSYVNLGYVKCSPFDDEIIFKEIPKLLYKLKIGSFDVLTLDLFEEKLGDPFVASNSFNGFRYDDLSAKVGLAKLNVTQGESDIPLELTCDSYSDVFNEKTAHLSQENATNIINNSMKIVLDPDVNKKIGYENVRVYDSVLLEDNGKSVPSRELMDKSRARRKAIEDVLLNKAFKSFANYISDREAQDINVNYQNQSFPVCKEQFYPKSVCKELGDFFGELKSSNILSISKCQKADSDYFDLYLHSVKDDNTIFGCAVIKTEISKARYLVHFKYSYKNSGMEYFDNFSELTRVWNNIFDNDIPRIEYLTRVH